MEVPPNFILPPSIVATCSCCMSDGGPSRPSHRGFSNFPDGFPNLFVKDAMRMRNRHVGFLASFGDPSTVFEQISIIYALPRMFIASFTLVRPALW